MKLKQLTQSTNFWIILSSALILILFYIFYLNYYVANRERRITATRFRVLDQMGDNIDKRMDGYIKNAKNLNEKIKAEWGLEKNKNLREDFKKNNKKPFIEYVNSQGDINKDLKIIQIITGTNPSVEFRNYIKTLSPYSYYIADVIKGPPFPVQSTDKTAIIVVEAPYRNLLKGLERKDVFDGLILIKDTAIVYNTLNQDMILTSGQGISTLIEQTNKTSENGEKSSFLFTSKNNVQTGSIFSGSAFDIDISNIPYKAFLKPVIVNKETWYVIGLMKKNKYMAASHSIAPWAIILLSMVLVLLMLGLPIIKLKVMSKTEQLRTGTIISSAISLLFGGSMIALFLFFLTQNATRKQNIDNNLKSLSAHIYETFTGELKNAYNQLEIYDNDYDSIDFNDPSNPYKNKIRNNILAQNNVAYPRAYPFADYYFWTGKNGVQSAYLTPFKEYGAMTDLSSRDYINKKDEWFLPDDESKKFRIESIVSFTSGNVKAAVSKPGKSQQRPVIALTSRLYSVIDPIIPKDYSFCIFDKTGKVWFHSDKNLNLKENFITECNDNHYLRAAMYRNISKVINVNYYNNPQRAYIRPMEPLPLYLVVLYNEKADKSFQAQIVTMTLTFMGLLFFMLFIQIIVLLFIERYFQWPLTKNHIFNITRPMMHLNSAYVYLTRLFGILFIVIIPFMMWLNSMQAVTALFIFAVIIFNYSFLILNPDVSRKPVKKWFTGFNLFLLILLNVAGNVMSGSEGFWKILLFEGTVLAVILLCHNFLKDRVKNEDRNYAKNYILFLIGLLLLLGILPTFKFYEAAYNTEAGIRIRHNQLALMKQRENRNAAISNYFRLIKPSKEAGDVLRKRKNLGIYTLFLDSTRFYPVNTNNVIRNGTPNNYWDTLFCYLRPFYDDYILENKYLIFNSRKSQDMMWKQDGHKLLFQYTSLTEDPDHNLPVKFGIESHSPQILLYLPFSLHDYPPVKAVLLNLIFWLSLAALLVVLYFLLCFGTRRLYCLNVIENYSHQSFITDVKYHISAHNNLLVYRLSALDETNLFSKDISKETETLYINWTNMNRVKATADLVQKNLDEFLLSKKEKKVKKKGVSSLVSQTLTIFIDHFDKDFQNPVDFSEKIKTVKLLTEKESIRIILLSQNSPETILKYYEEYGHEEKPDKKQNETVSKQYVEFKSLMTELVSLAYPVKYDRSQKDELRLCKQPAPAMDSGKFILSEVTATDYLKQLKPSVINYYNTQCKDHFCQNPEENTINKIMSLAKKYYKDLLESCSDEELYVLYDVADDMIVNPNNEKTVIRLLEKGLLKKECDRINFMNVSFRRFVLNTLNKAEASKLELKMGKNTGTWRGYRTTLVLIIAGLFVFIALANQDFIESLNQLFVAIGGGVAVITGILGLLSKKGKAGVS